jgi:hypothetical protein
MAFPGAGLLALGIAVADYSPGRDVSSAVNGGFPGGVRRT